jgi:ribosomal protein L9
MLENLEKHGSKGEIISVKRGFARNYLIPRKLAGEPHRLVIGLEHFVDSSLFHSLCHGGQPSEI